MKNKIIIILSGGCIQQVLGDPNVEVKIIDYDTENLSANEVVRMPSGWGVRDEVYITKHIPLNTNDPENFEEVWNLPESSLKKDKHESMLHQMAKLWLDLNGFDCSLDELCDHELDSDQVEMYNFLREQFNKL